MKDFRSYASYFLFFILLTTFFACNTTQYSSFGFLSREYKVTINRIMNEKDFANRFVIMNDLVRQVLTTEDDDNLRSLVHHYILLEPDDPFNSYYLLIVAEQYCNSELTLCEYYYNQILNYYDDVIVNDLSTHYRALTDLLERVTDPSYRIIYYNRLLSEFEQLIDPGPIWYLIAQEYRKNGQFEEYYKSLQKFQEYTETIVKGGVDIHQQVIKELKFHFNNQKDWTDPSLTSLVQNIKQALTYKQPQNLERYRAKETFFAMSWLQDPTDFNSHPRFDIGRFLLNAPRISYENDLTIMNQTEAYLKTSGWSYRIPNWYFYFRKVDYPADPEIHGNWEWAGIYFGDKL